MRLNKKKAHTYIANNYDIRITTNGWYKFDCPECDLGRHKQKCAVNFDWEHVKCWECGLSQRLFYFIRDTENLDSRQTHKLIDTYEESDFESTPLQISTQVSGTIELPFGYKSITSDGVLGQRARKYLTGRGFDIDELDYMGFGYCAQHAPDPKDSYFGYLIVPFKSNGKLIYYQGRDFLGRDFRFKNPPTNTYGIGKADCLFNEDALFMEDINFVTEGWADALTLGSMGISTQGWHFSTRQRELLLKTNASHLVFVPDVGFATDGISYYKKALQVAMEFTNITNTHVLNLEELGTGGKDVNDIGKLPVLELFEKSKPLTQGEIILKLIS